MKYPIAAKIKYSINVLIFKRVFLSLNLLFKNKVNREKAKCTKMMLRTMPRIA